MQTLFFKVYFISPNTGESDYLSVYVMRRSWSIGHKSFCFGQVANIAKIHNNNDDIVSSIFSQKSAP